MTTSGTSGKGVNSKKSWRSKAPGAPKDPTQSAKADSSLLSPAVLMALGMAGMAVAAVHESDSGASPQAENLAEQDLALDASQTLPQVTQAPVASDLQMQLADLITDLQAQAGQMPMEALPVDLNALLAAMAPQDSVGMEQIAGVSSAGAADMEPIMLAQATVAEAAVPQAASAASTAVADASAAAATAGAGAAAAGATSLSGVLLAAGAIGLAAAAGGGSSSGTSAPGDTVKPTVSTVAITSATGAANNRLNAGDVVTVTVTMSEATTVTGASTIDLLVGTTATVQAAYVSGSGTAALTYAYTILAGQADIDGISVVANTLAGTLKDAAGNTATLTHAAVADNASYLVDTTAPTITLLTASSSAGTVTLTYDSPLDAAHAPVASSFTVTNAGVIRAVDSLVSVSGSVVTLSVPGLTAGTLSVVYDDGTASDAANAIQDLAGNDAAYFSQAIVADGYIRGATVQIVDSNDAVLWTGTTDANGNFFIPEGISGTIIATGGVNIDTGVANTATLKAPEGSTTINPLTTLVQAVVQASGGTTSAADAVLAVASSLGLGDLDLLNYDPIASDNVDAQKAAAQVATIVALAESGSSGAGAAVIANLASVLSTAASGTVVDLADSTTVTDMLAGVTVSASLQSAIADASTAIGTSTSLTAISTAQSQALDKTAPNAPTVAVDADTKDTTPTIRVTLNTTATDGTAVNANDVLTLKDNNVQIGSAVTLTAADIAAGYKDVTVADANALTEGTHSLSVVVTDQAGNASAASVVKSVNVDLTPPAAPTISAVATDSVINSAEQTSAISGTAEAGASVSLSIGGNVRTATASTGGVWTYTLSAADVTAMGQGAETLSATATDAAGNVSTAATRAVTVDTAAPTTTAAVTGANDNVDPTTGNVATGGTSNDNTLGLSGTVSAALASGDVVAVYDASTRLGVATVSGTTWSFDTVGLTNAAHSFKAQVEDAAGNAGAQGTAYAVTVNATLPAATVSVTAAALTSDTTPSLSGAVTGTLATGDVVRVYDGTTLLGNAVVDGSTWVYTPGAALSEGAHSFTAVVQNSGGNQGTFSTAAATTIDATAPTAPVINAVATDNIVNSTEIAAGVAVGGTAESGASVTVTWGATNHTVTASNGTWTKTFSSAEVAAGGSTTISAVASDAAGNPSLAGTRAITVDTIAPTVTDVSVSAGDAINSSEFTAGVTITGATDAGARVDITFADTTTVRSVTAGSTGTWTYTLTKADISAMGQGSETFTVKATDTAGNTGAAASTTISIDTAAPTLSSFALTTASDSGTQADGKSNVAAPSIQLTAELGSTLFIDLGNGAGYQAAGTGTGASQTLTAGSAYTADASYTIKVKSTDAAGNATERSGSYTYDASAPSTPTVNAVATDNIVNATEKAAGVAVSGTAEAASSVVVTWGDATKTVTATAGGTWSTSFSILPADASTTISAVATDAAGNASVAGTRSVTVDTASALPVVSLVAADNVVNATEKAASVAVSGTAEAGASVLVTWGATSRTVTAGQGGAWTTTFSSSEVPADASTTISAIASDAAGNVASSAVTRSVTVDTSSAIPVISAVATDNVVNATEKAAGVAVSGTAEAGASVLVSWGDASHTVTATNGAWTTTFSSSEVPADASTVISAVASDTAGNAASSAATRAVTVDTVSATPVINAVSTDNTVNAAEKSDGVAVSGTAEAGASVAVTWGTASKTVTAGTGGVWTTSFSSSEVPSTSATMSAVASDTAGNAASVAGTRAVVVDTAAPTIASLSPTDNGLSLGLTANLIVTMNEAVAKGTGSLTLYKAGDVLVETIDVSSSSQVTLSQDGTIVTINPTAELVKGETYYVKAASGTFTDTAGNAWAGISDSGTWNFTGAGATVTINAVASDNTVNLVESGSAITVTGTLGAESAVLAAYTVANMTAVITGTDVTLTNLTYEPSTGAWSAVIPQSSLIGTADYTLTVSFKGTAGAATDVNGDAVQVVHVDTVAAAPTLGLTTDSGANGTDTITNSAALKPTGEVGSTFQYSADGTTGWSATAPTATTGANTVYARQTDTAGNVSAASSALTFTLDTTVATPTLALSSNTGLTTDTITSAGGVNVTGLENGATWEYSTNAGASWTTGTGTSLSLTGDGPKSVTVRQTDVAGNVSSVSSALAFTLDATAAAPTLALASDTGVSGEDKITNVGTVNVTGLESGATWEYSTSAMGNWTAGSGTSFTLSGDGAKSVAVRQTDVAGNVSASSTSLAFTLDTGVPDKGVISTMTAPAASTTYRLSGDNTPTITLTAETGAQIVLGQWVSGTGVLVDTTWYTAVESATNKGTYTVNVTSALADGSYGLVVVDAAGNRNSALITDGTVAATFAIETVAPTVTINVPATLTDGAATVTFNFSETVYGFTAADISVANGSASATSFQSNASGTSYTALITPTSSTTPLALTIDVAAGVAFDAARNLSTVATQFATSALIGTSGNDTLTVSAAKDLIYLGAGTDTIKLSSATGSTAALTDGVQGFGSGDKIDLSAILGSLSGGAGYTSSALADTGFGFVELKNVTLTHATSTTTTVGFDITFDAATYEGNKISGAVIDLAYTYASVTSASVKSVTYTDTFGDAANFWPLMVTNMTGSSGTGKITAAAFSDTSSESLWTDGTNTIIDSTGRTIAIKLVISENVSTFQLGFDGVGIVTTTSTGTDNSYTPTTGVTKTAGASSGTTGVLEIVSDTDTLSTIGDNQLHMLTTYDSATGLTRLLVQYDSNSTYGTTTESSIIAMDFVGDLTSVLTPASLTFI